MNRFLVFVVGLSFLGSGFGQEKLKSPEKAKVVLEKVWEKKFDEPVCDVIFDEVEVTVKEAKKRGWRNLEGRKDNEKVKIPYVKVAIGSQVKFYDKNKKIIKTAPIKGDRIYISPNGKYILIGKRPNEFAPERQGGILYTNNGKKIWRKTSGGFPIAVSDEGYVIAWQEPYETEPPGDFIFYSPEGHEINRIKNPYAKKATGWGLAKFTEDGDYVILGYTDTYAKSVIILTTKYGKIIWQKEINYDAFHRCAEIIGVKKVGIWEICTERKTKFGVFLFFLDWHKNLKWKISLGIGGNMVIKLSQNQQKIFISSTEGYLWCLDAWSGNLIWKHKEKWAPKGLSIPYYKVFKEYDVPLFYEMEIFNSVIFIKGRINTEKREWYASAILLFDAEDGNQITTINYPNKKIFLKRFKNKIFTLNKDMNTLHCIRIKK